MTSLRFTRETSATVENVESALSRASESLTLAHKISGALAEYIDHDYLWRSKI